MNPYNTVVLCAAMAVGTLAHAQAATVTFNTNNVVFTGTGMPVSVAGSDGTVFTFDAGPTAQFQSFNSGFPGSFPIGSPVLTTGLGNTSPLTITFSQPIFSIALPVASDRVGNSPYTTTVDFFNGSDLVDSITQMGNAMNPADVFSYRGAITSATIETLVAPGDAPFGYTQNIGAFSYNVSSVPLPASAPMFGAALLALAATGYSLKRKASAAA
jgi:hypothetical protein